MNIIVTFNVVKFIGNYFENLTASDTFGEAVTILENDFKNEQDMGIVFEVHDMVKDESQYMTVYKKEELK